MNENVKYDLKFHKGDFLHTTINAALSSVPIIGGAASTFFSTIVASPVSKRRDNWLITIYDSLKELEKNIPDFHIDKLSDNDMFITTIMNATQIVLRNHQEEKLEALKNAVLNSSIKIGIEENMQLMFINNIDGMTPWHLKILRFFDNPTLWFEEKSIKLPEISTGSPEQILIDAYPELRGKENIYTQIVKDLFTQGLINIEKLRVNMSSSGAMQSRVTELGHEFIRYIKYPYKPD